jgi:hypothetical protein
MLTTLWLLGLLLDLLILDKQRNQYAPKNDGRCQDPECVPIPPTQLIIEKKETLNRDANEHDYEHAGTDNEIDEIKDGQERIFARKEAPNPSKDEDYRQAYTQRDLVHEHDTPPALESLGHPCNSKHRLCHSCLLQRSP